MWLAPQRLTRNLKANQFGARIERNLERVPLSNLFRICQTLGIMFKHVVVVWSQERRHVSNVFTLLSRRSSSYSYNTCNTIKTQSHSDVKNAWHLPQDPTDIARLKTTGYPAMIRCKVAGAMRLNGKIILYVLE